MSLLALSLQKGYGKTVCRGRTETTEEQGRALLVGLDSKQYVRRGKHNRLQ